MVIKENVCSHKFSDMSCKPIKFKKKCYCLCPLLDMINSRSFICWLDMINLCSFYAGNNVVVKDDKNTQSIFRHVHTLVTVGSDW